MLKIEIWPCRCIILLEYSSNYSDTTDSLWFYSYNEATNFNADIMNTNDFKSLKYEAKLLGNTETNRANGILGNAVIDVPLNYLSNFWSSLEMSLINCKVKLKLKWTNHCVLSAIVMLILIILFLLSKAQNDMSL